MSSVRYWSLSGEDRTQEVENEGEETPKLKHKGKEITVLPELRFERDMPSARTEVIIPQDVFERVEATVSMRRPSAQPESSADSSDRPGPSGTAQQLDEQLREILGDLEIPEGVDPAFLAALPEDMRREVIRDHLRQQGRVSVARSQPAESIVGAPVVVNENADGEGDDANANLSPPLDQEFLTALPPELQQELIEQHERDVRLAREAQNPPSNPPVEEPVDHGALLECFIQPGTHIDIVIAGVTRNDGAPVTHSNVFQRLVRLVQRATWTCFRVLGFIQPGTHIDIVIAGLTRNDGAPVTHSDVFQLLLDKHNSFEMFVLYEQTGIAFEHIKNFVMSWIDRVHPCRSTSGSFISDMWSANDLLLLREDLLNLTPPCQYAGDDSPSRRHHGEVLIGCVV
ncbi:hypothetical protein QR680_002567 [Steinernema hermaphroditum]|uniref:Uncharacterized protein n=1 Tax=Steinernema hermaphroditum TaxID=289476 RepID=A0AA39H432_9BILA|nr:hypothetical protein QR680_002567 [Steinernema hermaphroditum]